MHTNLKTRGPARAGTEPTYGERSGIISYSGNIGRVSADSASIACNGLADECFQISRATQKDSKDQRRHRLTERHNRGEPLVFHGESPLGGFLPVTLNE